MTGNRLVTRGEVLSGQVQLQRRATKVLASIELRILYMRAESRRALAVFLLGDHVADVEPFRRQFDLDFLQGIKERVRSTDHLSTADLERFAPHWQALVPSNPALRATLLHLLVQRYPLAYDCTPGIRAALGVGMEVVRATYQQTYGRPIDTLFAVAGSPAALDDRERYATPIQVQALHDGASVEAQDDATPSDAQQVLRAAEAGMEWLHVPGGTTLFHQGEAGDALYMLISGRLRVVVVRDDGSVQVVSELGRGELVGEMGVLTGEPRSATVQVLRDSELVKVSHSTLMGLAQRYGQVMMRVNRILADRLRASISATQRAANTVITFAVVPAGGEAPLADFARRFAETLASYAPTLHLSSTRLAGELGVDLAQVPPDHPESARLLTQLSEQESHYRYVVYEADARPSHWTDRCLRQADRVLILAQSSTNPAPGAVDAQIARWNASARAALVLMHPPTTRQPGGTHRWLAAHQVRAHYHVRLNDDDDLKRLARRLTGRSIGLVLGGGGARGYAHVGVIRALEEAGIEVDLVGGTSMGALVGALYATGLDSRAIAGVAKRFGSPKALFDYTIPMVAFFSSHKVTAMLQTLFADAQIEDLWRPCFCVSTNLTEARPMIHRQGPVWTSVRASLAVPGVFSPLLDEAGHVLIDGGIMNNLPVEIMRDEVEGGRVIAASASVERDLVTNYAFGPGVSGWQVAWSRLNPFAPSLRVPSLFAIMMRSAELNDVYRRHEKRELADLFIAPPLEPFSMLNFRPSEQIAAVGYRAARQALAAWQQQPAAVPSTAS